MKKKSFEQALHGAFVRYNHMVEQSEQEPVPEMSPAFLQKMDDYIRSQTKQEEQSMTKHTTSVGKKWKKAWTVAIAAAIVVGGSVCVYATVPAVRERINMLFLQKESVARLHEVPDGWMGIYTAEDLEKIREDLSGRYILMNDIVIPPEAYEPGGLYENGFTPIGGTRVTYTNEDGRTMTKADPFTGICNGNGYTIANVQIQSLQNDTAGLFGECEMQYDMWDEETGEQKHRAGGIIKNLGVIDSSVTITDEDHIATNTSVGMIVGKGGFVVGCYTENVAIDFVAPETKTNKTICIGGVAGEAHIIDSCYTNASITVETNANQNLYVAGVCGWSKACVTSYFDGTIDAPVSDWEVCYIDETDPPEMLNDATMFELIYQLLCKDYGMTFDKAAMEACWYAAIDAGEYPGDAVEAYVAEQGAVGDAWDYRHVFAFYCGKTNVNPQDYLTYTSPNTENRYERVYLLDPCTTVKERAVLSQLIAGVFDGEAFVTLCQENGVKYGGYHNYDLRREPDCTYEGFDFDYIWRMGDDGKPVLRLFTWSKEDGVETYPSELSDVVRK